ncbi:MAG TPA: enoyl-CoA hydratase/isomerase family protein [Burkholderiales bacterium]|nr:enoyl-CoA hydratase/isomerase family protein [Burkholderiales bacterium]
MDNFTTLHYAFADGVARVTLDRPEARNALNMAMCEELIAVARKAQAEKEARLLIIRGAGPAFCAGADLKERADKTADWVRTRRMRAFEAYDALESLPFPVVAAVHGPAMGAGVEICTICDIVVATPQAFFGTPEAQRGTIGATQRLGKIIGRHLAKDMMFTGRRLTAEEARDAGLVARVVPRASLDAELDEITKAIVSAPAMAIRQAKHCINRAMELDAKGALAVEIAAIDEQLAAGTWLGKK